MIAYYPMLKHLHMTLALVSLLLFLYRWSLALAGFGYMIGAAITKSAWSWVA